MGDGGGSGLSRRADFEAAVLPHLEALLRLARSLMRGHRADAEDLVQDAVLRAFEAFPHFQPGTNLRAWLFRILRNTYVDWLRKRGRQAELNDLEAEVPESSSAVEEFRAQAAHERAEADLEAALARLPAELRMALLLVDGEGMRYDEVAEVMGCPVGTVRSRLHRGRGLLRQQLLEISRRKPARRGQPNMRTIHLKVPTIKCEGCVEKIRDALTKRRGVETVEGDPDQKEITVTFHPDQLSESDIRAAISGAGFLVG